MSRSDFYLSDTDIMDFEEIEDELFRAEAVALQAQVIEQQGQDIFRSIMALDAGVQSAQTLRVQQQLLTKLHALLSSGALAAPLREPVGEEHLKLMQFYNEVVRPQDSIESTIEAPEDARTDSESDEDDTDSMNEDVWDPVVVVESSSDEEYQPEDEATARANELREAYFSRETDSESEDEDRFKNLNVHYI